MVTPFGMLQAHRSLQTSPAAAARIRTVMRRVGLLAVAVMVTATVHPPARPASLCILRTLTGIPCPFCGGTTAAVHLGHGDLGGAVAASPLAVAMLAVAPFAGAVAMPAWLARPLVWRSIIATALVGGELWQLARFGFLPIHLG
jgi:hypothetical protein